MGQLIGLYIAFVLMEAVVAIPAYYLFRALAGKRYVEWIALSSVILGLGAGWVSGYRFTKDVMVEAYLVQLVEERDHQGGLTQREWNELRQEFIKRPNNVEQFHVGAAKASIPAAVFVAIFLFWLAERHKGRWNTERVESTAT